MVTLRARGRESLCLKVTDRSVLGSLRTGLVYLLKGLRGNMGKREGSTFSVSMVHQAALCLYTQFTDEEIEVRDNGRSRFKP